MTVDAVLALLVLLVLGNYWLSRSVLYPPLLFCGMWFLVLSMYRMELIETDPIHTNTVMILAMGSVLFTAGGVLAMLCPSGLIQARFILTRFPARNKVIKLLVIVFLFCGLPLLLRSLEAMASGGVGATIFTRARTAAAAGGGGGDGSFPLLAYFILWPFYAATLFLIERRDKGFWFMTFIAFMAGLLSTGRLPVLMLISALTCVHLLKTGRVALWPALKFARVPILLFMFLYFGLIFLLKDTSVYEGGIGTILLYFLVGYIVGPTAALDYFVQHPGEYVGPNHTFKFFLTIASKLHLVNYEAASGYGTFLAVPYPVNVYTMYRDYLSDFGFYGGLTAILIIGFLHTLLYRKARTGSELGIYFFSITFFAVFMSPFSDEYSAFGSYIDALLFAAIYIVARSLRLRVLPELPSGYGVPTTPDAPRI
jgi:oligosaccharide repeat unit polymerase